MEQREEAQIFKLRVRSLHDWESLGCWAVRPTHASGPPESESLESGLFLEHSRHSLASRPLLSLFPPLRVPQAWFTDSPASGLCSEVTDSVLCLLSFSPALEWKRPLKYNLQEERDLSQFWVCLILAALGLHCSAWASLVVAHRHSCLEACGILVPQLGIKPTSPELEGGFLTTGPGTREVLEPVFLSFFLCCILRG